MMADYANSFEVCTTGFACFCSFQVNNLKKHKQFRSTPTPTLFYIYICMYIFMYLFI